MLHRYLDGDPTAPEPIEYTFSRLCEEFPGHLPSAIKAEMDLLPDGFLQRLVESRNYGAAKQIRDQTHDQTKLPQTPLFQMVERIEFDLVEEAMQRDRE